MKRTSKLPRELAPLISRARIQRRLAELAREIPLRIPARERPIAVVVLQGAFVFAADLLRRLPVDYPIGVTFLRCESYGARTLSSGRVLLLNDLDGSVKLRGRTVLLIDDILDTGLTTRFLLAHLAAQGAKRIRLCVLLNRRQPRSGMPERPTPDFAGFAIGPQFVVGYGLDYHGKYRNLPDLAGLKT